MVTASKFNLAVAAFALVWTAAAQAALPSWKFRVLVSPHFEVVYRSDEKDLAKRYILAAEQARELLTPYFSEMPDTTIIYIDDGTDISNGSAGFLPYPMISVYPVQPTTLDSVDDYGDWPLEMIVHEYTHILNMYPRHGFYTPLKWIFGGVVRPNAVLPKWYLEGLAVNDESRLTDHGRLRADETQALARSLVLGDRFKHENIASINEQEISSYPYGARPYVYGAWWWESVQKNNGQKIIDAWNQDFSRRIPFLLNGPMEDQTEKNAQGLLEMSFGEVGADAEAQIKTLKASGPQVSTQVAGENGEVSVFAVSPSGNKLAYIVDFAHDSRTSASPGFGSELRLKIRSKPGQPFKEITGKRLLQVPGTTRIHWMDDNRFVFDLLDVKKPYVSYRDLWVYDLEHGQPRRLTDGERAQEPAPSPKNDAIAFIRNEDGKTSLELLPFDNSPGMKEPKVLVAGGFQQRLSGPEFLNDDEILFVLHAREGWERIYVYNLKDGKARLWNTTLNSAQNLRKTQLGILVSDDSTHVRNIYVAGPGDSAPRAITNTLTYIKTADYDPQTNELLYSEQTPDGRRLESTPFKTYTPASIGAVNLPPPPAPKTDKVAISDEDYEPFKYLVPQYWIPFVYSVENGGLLAQGITSNADPAGRNAYTAAGSIDTITKKPSYGLSYSNFSTPTEIDLSYAKAITYLGASNLTTDSQAGALNLGLPWPDRFTHWYLGGAWSDTQGVFDRYRRIGPQVGVQFNRLQSSINSWFGYMGEYYYQDFVSDSGYLHYDRSYAHVAGLVQLPHANNLFLQARASYAPLIPKGGSIVDIGDRNVGGNYLVNLANSDFLLRGYPSGEFVGREVVNTNLEYSLPIIELARGWGTFPLWARAMELVGFVDGFASDGYGYRLDLNAYHPTTLNEWFMSTGAELRVSTTAGYHLPISWTFGAYYGLNTQYGGGFTPFFSFGWGELSPLNSSNSASKTP